MLSPHEPRIRAEHDSLECYLRSVLPEGALSRPLLLSFTQWDFAVAAVCEATLTLSSMGADVHLGLWSDETPLRDVGWQVQHGIARALGSPTIDDRAKRALRAAGLADTAFIPTRPWSPQAPVPRPVIPNRSSIRALTYRGAPLGRGVLEVPPAKDIPVTDEYLWPTRYVDAAARSYAFVYDQARRVIEDDRITAVFTYNGRFLHDSAVAAAAEHYGLPVLAYDTGGTETDFDLTIDATHDWSALQHRMLAMYDRWPEGERDVIGRSWFTGRMEHSDPANALFTGTQTRGTGIDRQPGDTVVVFFSSSGDEIAELDLDWSRYFNSQPQALTAVAKACREAGYRLVVRTHPHKRLKAPRDVADWLAAVDAASPDLHIDQHSSVDSYALMKQADVVVTYGSTTGVEAGFLERPVIVMGPSAYDELGCAMPVHDEVELGRALAERRHGTWRDAVPYGLMMKRRGFAYRYLDVDQDGTRSLVGVPLVEPRPLVRHMSHALRKRSLRRLGVQPTTASR